MHERSLHIAFIILGWLILCGSAPAAMQSHNDPKIGKVETKLTPPPSASGDTNPNAQLAPDVGHGTRCYTENNKNTAALCDQERSIIAAEKAAHEARRTSNFALLALLISALGVPVSVWGIWLIRATLRAQIVAERPHVRFYGTHKAFDKRGNLTRLNGIIVKNYGRTPAIVQTIFIQYVVSKSPPLPEQCNKKRNFPDDIIISNEELFPRNWYIPPLDGEILLKDLLPLHGKNGYRLFVFGRILYKDAFGKKHETGFCRQFNGRDFTYNQTDINDRKDLNYTR